MSSLPDMDLQAQLVTTASSAQLETVTKNYSKESLKVKSRTVTGRPEYMGLCLPVDIAMLFQVSDDWLCCHACGPHMIYLVYFVSSRKIQLKHHFVVQLPVTMLAFYYM